VTACVVSLVVSLLQTLTSVQEQTLTAVPRLVVVFVVTVAVAALDGAPASEFHVHLFTGFHKYLG